jgi:glycine/D-amino acid oxidase-like deaminating enzyme
VEADIVVLAMGTWSGQGTAWLGGEIPIQMNRDECVRLEVPQRLPSYQLRTLAGHTILPKVDGSVLLGHAGVSDLQNSFDVNLVTEEGKTDLLEGAIDLLPSLQEAKLIEHRGDFEAYSVPPKNIQPVIGRLPKWDNAYVAARFGTMGFNMALGTGQCMADLIINRGLAPLRVKTMMDILSPARLE